MPGPFKQLVEIRARLKERIPKFLRVNYARYKRIKDSWRKQRGRDNKIRKSIKGAGAKVSVGYGTPKNLKHIHPSGYREILIRSLRDLENVDPKTDAIRISSSIGLKKRLEILKIAKERGIHVINPNVISRVRDKGYSSVKEMLEAMSLSSKRITQKEEEEKKEDKEEEKKEEKPKKSQKKKTTEGKKSNE